MVYQALCRLGCCREPGRAHLPRTRARVHHRRRPGPGRSSSPTGSAASTTWPCSTDCWPASAEPSGRGGGPPGGGAARGFRGRRRAVERCPDAAAEAAGSRRHLPAALHLGNDRRSQRACSTATTPWSTRSSSIIESVRSVAGRHGVHAVAGHPHHRLPLRPAACRRCSG